MSKPVSTFWTPMRMVARCGSLSAVETKLTCMFWMLKNHGAWQLLRPATALTCDFRQPAIGESSRSVDIADWPAASSAELVGAKMNARSLLNPSPLMSPLTIGENGVPDDRRALVLNVTALWNV